VHHAHDHKGDRQIVYRGLWRTELLGDDDRSDKGWKVFKGVKVRPVRALAPIRCPP
jgi:hypothetical protein